MQNNQSKLNLKIIIFFIKNINFLLLYTHTNFNINYTTYSFRDISKILQ